MANYTAEQLYGTGTPIEELLGGSEYNFTLTRPESLSGSGYFYLESDLNREGNYFKSQNAKGIISSLINIHIGVVRSPFVFGMVVEPSGGSFNFTPDTTIPLSGSYLRATGGMSLGINLVAGTSFIATQNNDPLITENGDNLIIN